MIARVGRRPSLRTVTIAVMAAAMVVAIASAYLLYHRARVRDQARSKVDIEVQEITAYNDVQISVAYEGEYIASYLLLRDDHYLDLFRQQRVAANAALQRTRTALVQHGDAAEVTTLDDLAARHSRINDAEDRGLQAIAAGDPARALAIAAQTDVVNQTTELTDSLNAAVANARTELAAAQSDDASADANFLYALVAISTLWSAALLLLGLAILRWLVRPLGLVRSASEAVADGDLQHRVPITGPHELARVGESVNRMTETLIRRSEELNTYLSQNLEARTRELEATNAALDASESRFRSLVRDAADLITLVTSDMTIAYQSPAIERVLGITADSVIGTPLSRLIHPDDWNSMRTYIVESARHSAGVRAVEVRLRHEDGSWRDVEIVGSDRRRDSSVGGYVLNMRDVTERRSLEDQLRKQAFEDPLTGLANRARFNDRLDHALRRAARARTGVAVLFLDLDNFKRVNDTLGHATGDQLLAGIGLRLVSSVRDGDTVARLGGDEFAVLLEDLQDDPGVATRTAERILHALREPFTLGGTELFARASIGIAESRGGAVTAGDLLRDADVAVYHAKAQGKGRYALYDTEMRASMLDRLDLLADLDGAVRRGEFVVHYQPTVSLRDGRFVGAEALVRWQHPHRGLLQPDVFIPLAEESGVIVELGSWVLREACQQAAIWQRRCNAPEVFSMSINVSVRQLVAEDFPAVLAETLTDSKVDPEGVVLEITESVMMGRSSSMIDVLRTLKSLGVKLAIDDFGTGYSSLSYLRQFPFDILKIDKSFVGDEPAEHNGQLERAIIDLGRTLNLQIVAEGIERPDQLARLRELTCDLGQGYLFSRPLPAQEVELLLQAGAVAERAA
jgi:diguanylate cyclase (GGDEF)-like protein/PAS domain S-box-containing protein